MNVNIDASFSRQHNKDGDGICLRDELEFLWEQKFNGSNQ